MASHHRIGLGHVLPFPDRFWQKVTIDGVGNRRFFEYRLERKD